MNDPEEIMHYDTREKNSGLIAHRVALEAAASALQLVKTIPAPLRSLSTQVVKAASSVPANLSEGVGRTGRDRYHHWRIAYASALETSSHIELLLSVGAVDSASARITLETLDRVRALTWKLMRSRR